MSTVQARWLLGVLLVAAVASGCARAKARRVMRANEARQEHEILCSEGLSRCADAISRYCKNRYHARAFTVVREEPERGVVIVVCEPR